MKPTLALGAHSILAGFLLLSLTSAGQTRKAKESEYQLGKVQFTISCSDEAQREFNRGVVLLHHMTYPQAKTVFEHMAGLDPHNAR